MIPFTSMKEKRRYLSGRAGLHRLLSRDGHPAGGDVHTQVLLQRKGELLSTDEPRRDGKGETDEVQLLTVWRRSVMFDRRRLKSGAHCAPFALGPSSGSALDVRKFTSSSSAQQVKSVNTHPRSTKESAQVLWQQRSKVKREEKERQRARRLTETELGHGSGPDGSLWWSLVRQQQQTDASISRRSFILDEFRRGRSPSPPPLPWKTQTSSKRNG